MWSATSINLPNQSEHILVQTIFFSLNLTDSQLESLLVLSTRPHYYVGNCSLSSVGKHVQYSKVCSYIKYLMMRNIFLLFRTLRQVCVLSTNVLGLHALMHWICRKISTHNNVSESSLWKYMTSFMKHLLLANQKRIYQWWLYLLRSPCLSKCPQL